MSLPRYDEAGETGEKTALTSSGPFRILLIGAKASIILFVVSALLRL